MHHRLQKFSRQFFPIARERLHQIAIGARVAAELSACKIDILMKTRGASIIEWMRERDLRLNPTKAEAFERQCLEKWRTRGERMNCRTNIVHKTWQGEFGRTRTAADRLVPFQDQNGKTCPRQRNRGGHSIRTRPDYDRVMLVSHRTQ